MSTEVCLIDCDVLADECVGGHVQGGAQAGPAAGYGVAAAREDGLRGMGGVAGKAGHRLAVKGGEFGHFDPDQGRDARRRWPKD